MRNVAAACLALCVSLVLSACSASGQQAQASTSALSQGTLTCGPDSTRNCTEQGQVRWSRALSGKYVFKKDFILPATTHPDGTFPDAAIAKNLLVYVEGATAMAIDRTTGRVRWRTTIGAGDKRLKYDPAVFAGAGFVAVRLDVGDPRKKATHLWILRAGTGEPVSDFALPDGPYYVRGIVGGAVILLGETRVLGINLATGKKKWEAALSPWSGSTVAGHVLYADDNRAEPASSGTMRRIQRIDLKTGKRLPTLKLPESLRGAARLQSFRLRNTVYVATHGKDAQLAALNATNGQVLWTKPIKSGAHSYFVDLDRAFDPPILYWRSGDRVHAWDGRTGNPVTKPRSYEQFQGWGVAGGITVHEVGEEEEPEGTRLEGRSTHNGKVRWRAPRMLAFSKIASWESGSPRLLVGLACAPGGVRPAAESAPSSNERCVEPRLFALNR